MELKLKQLRESRFISHYVQIKPSSEKPTKEVEPDLYPTTFK